MLWLYLSISLLLYSAPQTNKNITSSDEEFSLQKMEKIFEKRCLLNADSNAFMELKEAAFNFNDCMVKDIQAPKTDEDIINMVCTAIRHSGYSCLEDLLEKLEPCLDLEEKYLPDFCLKAHNISFDQECNSRGKNLEDKVSALKSSQCNPKIEECVPKIKLLKNLLKADYVITKTDLCSNIETAKECAVDRVKSHCKDDLMVEVFATIFNQFLSLCDDL